MQLDDIAGGDSGAYSEAPLASCLRGSSLPLAGHSLGQRGSGRKMERGVWLRWALELGRFERW